MTQSIEAPRPLVYAVLANFESYPEFITDIVSVSRSGSDYTLLVKAAILTIPARMRVDTALDDEIRFTMIEGPVDVLTGKWVVAGGQKPGETQVTLMVEMEAGQRSEWLLRMTGRFVQSKTGKLVDAFRGRVEAVHRGEVAPAVAARPVRENALLRWLRWLWQRLMGGQETAPAQPTTHVSAPTRIFTDAHQVATLDALAATIIPPDDFDSGAQGIGFPEVAEVRSRYEAARADLYRSGLRGVDRLAERQYGKLDFVALTPAERTALLDAIRQDKVEAEVWGSGSPGDFFDALWEDTVFLYCTHPDTWQRLGWPGPSFDRGGYPDFDQQQTSTGVTHVR